LPKLIIKLLAIANVGPARKKKLSRINEMTIFRFERIFIPLSTPDAAEKKEADITVININNKAIILA
jgi:hypothetical protein